MGGDERIILRTQSAQWPDGAIFTVGHSTLPIERFVALLHTYGIERLVDIRTVPRSRHNPQFNAEALADALQGGEHRIRPAGLARRFAPSAEGLAQHGLAQRKLSRLRRLHADRSVSERARRAPSNEPTETCRHHVRGSGAVAMPPFAGRRCVERARHAVIDILSESSHQRHELTPFARVEGTTITYPPDQASLL